MRGVRRDRFEAVERLSEGRDGGRRFGGLADALVGVTEAVVKVDAQEEHEQAVMRASCGRGFFAPRPFVDETDATGLSRLEPLAGPRAETADTASLDFGYARGRSRRI